MNKVKLGVLISGSGSNLQSIIDYIEAGHLSAKIEVVISNEPDAYGLTRAQNHGLKTMLVNHKDFPSREAFDERLVEVLKENNIELVVLAGFMRVITPTFLRAFPTRVMNIHPALLPSFGGQGMWGHHVHEAVLAAGAKVSGCTVHFCTNEYDKGPIIVQRTCEVKEGDTPDTLAARVFEQECIAYPQAIKLFAEGKLLVQNNKIKMKS